LRNSGGRENEKERAIEGVNLINAQYMHVRIPWCNSFVQLIYTNKNATTGKKLNIKN
jgi:hypothetical protein